MRFISWSCLTKCGGFCFLIQPEFWKVHAIHPVGKIRAVLLWYWLLCWKILIATTGITLLGCTKGIQAHIGAVADHSNGVQQGVQVKFPKQVPGWNVAGKVLPEAIGELKGRGCSAAGADWSNPAVPACSDRGKTRGRARARLKGCWLTLVWHKFIFSSQLTLMRHFLGWWTTRMALSLGFLSFQNHKC